MRKFEYVKRVTSTGYETKDPGFKLPERATKHSAGYDFYNPEKVEIPPYKIGDNPILVKTGVKAYMQDDEYLSLVNRSSNPKKKKLVIPNSVGIIDSDYVDNPENEGELGFLFYNLSNETVILEKGDKLGQGIFQKYLTVDDDNAKGERTGGFGSTDKNKTNVNKLQKEISKAIQSNSNDFSDFGKNMSSIKFNFSL